jgi:RNA polymerase sigma-70 factor (ECF subfamily)
MTVQDYNNCVDEYSDGVYRFILKNLKDEDNAKDVVQEAFTKMWERAEDVDSSKAKSYIFTTAYHTMIDFIRKNKRLVSEDEVYRPEPSSARSYSDLNEILEDALEKLSEVQKSVVLLRDYEGYSYQEIGEIVNLNESQVKVYIYRARLALKKYIGSIEAVV